MQVLRKLIIVCLVLQWYQYELCCQTLGGNAAYSFLKLPGSPQITALGGDNISAIAGDIGLAFNNPALLNIKHHRQLQVSFNTIYANTKNSQAIYAQYYKPLQTSFAAGVHFLSYGSITQTDAAGNSYGNLRPFDYSIQLSASKKYLQNWQYGITLKFIASNYGIYRSSAIAMDAGVLYFDSAHQWQASLLLKNMGGVVKPYNNTTAEDLPFDAQAGISKKLANAPVQFSLTAHHLHRFDILYNDATFNNQTGSSSANNKSFTIDKLFRHLVFSTQLFVGDKVELTAGYHHLRRRELSINNTPNGLTGFSLGVGVLLKKMHLRYARTNYQNNTGLNQIGLSIFFNQFTKIN